VSDVRADDQLLDELEQKFLHTIDSMAGGTSVAVNEKVHQSRMPLGANAAEALDCAVNVMKRDVKVYLVASACAAKRQKLVQPALEVAWGSPQPLRCAISLYRMRARIGRRSFRPWWREITKRGKTLWFSEYEITLGDSLRARIDRGLSESRFGIVVLSHAFFAKPWPQSELDALGSRSMQEGRKVILPIRHQMLIDELRSKSPLLAGLLSVDSSIGAPAVVDAIITAYDAERC